MQLNKLEKFIPEMKFERRKEFAKIDWKSYGFRSKADIKFDASVDIVNTGSIILLIPKKIYELEAPFEIPVAPTEKANNLTTLLADSFERLRVKVEHVIHECDSIKISEFAKKNINEASRIHFKIKQRLKRVVSTGNSENIFIFYIQGLFIAHVMHYFLKVFEEFYKGKDYSHLKMKSELLDIINGYSNMFHEPQAEYKTEKKEEPEYEDVPEELKIMINGQINIFITALYDMRKKELQNKKMYLSGTDKAFIHFISKNVVDKNGESIKKTTIIKCMQDYNDDKKNHHGYSIARPPDYIKQHLLFICRRWNFMKKALHIFTKVICIMVTISIFTSCSPERRLHRLIALHPELVKNDTIRIQDTTFLPEIKIDTVVHESQLQDTITITKEKLTVRIHRLRDTIYIAAHQEPDTIIITKEIPVEKVIHKQPEPIHEKIWGYFRYNFLFSIFCIVILIAFIFGISRR